MSRLKYTFTNDTLFKMLFVRNPELLKRLVAALLGIPLGSIGEFAVTNPEMPPDMIGDKFCRLDINMTVNGQIVDLEIQVANEGNYPERSLYYWSREFSSTLSVGETYKGLPRVVVISILGFNLFDCLQFHTEFEVLEKTLVFPLTDKLSLHYFELPKLPAEIDPEKEERLWLSLFSAETEQDLMRLEALNVPVMSQAIGAYRSVTATREFVSMERARAEAVLNKAAALAAAARKEAEKWKTAIATKDAEIARLQALLSQSSPSEER
jgi:predicted transposase/invertase (TIGR01784 family)